MLVVESPSRNVLVLDCLEPVIPRQIALARAGGYPAIGQYVNLSEAPAPFSLTVATIEQITAAQMGVFVIQVGRSSGWSDVTGRADGLAAARNMLSLGLPPATVLVCDHEGPIPSKSASLDYCQAWWSAATSQGATELRFYEGEGQQLDGSELFHALSFRGYWLSPSEVPLVAVRGYQAFQLNPLGQEALGPGNGTFDVSAIQPDREGGRWAWARAA